tara:strand:+ start:867 stop:1499 length:633 start_codon:yes stop_codon:yes gene_type:complete
MIDYNKIKEENAACMFIESGQDLVSLNPKRFIEECKKIPLLSVIMDKTLPCKEDVETMRLNRGIDSKGVINKKKFVKYATPEQLAERYELAYDAEGSFSLVRIPDSFVKGRTIVTTRACKYSKHIKVTIRHNGTAKTMFFSDVVFCLHHGRWPTMMQLDGKQNNGSAVIHADGDITNNHPNNLRENLKSRAISHEFLRENQGFLPNYMDI